MNILQPTNSEITGCFPAYKDSASSIRNEPAGTVIWIVPFITGISSPERMSLIEKSPSNFLTVLLL